MSVPLHKGLYWRGKVLWIRWTENGKQQKRGTKTDDIPTAVAMLTEILNTIPAAPKKKKRKKEMEGVYLRGGVYWISFTGIDGKQKRISAKTSVYDEAKALLERKRLAQLAKRHPDLGSFVSTQNPDGRTTVKDFIDQRYYPAHAEQAAIVEKKYLIEPFKVLYGHLPVNKLSSDIFLDFRDDYLKPRGITSATRNRYRTALLHVVSYARQRKALTKSEYDSIVEDYDKEPESSASWLPLTDDEMHRLMLTIAEKPWLHEIVVFAVWTGWRSSHVKKLTWNRVDLERNLIYHPPKNPQAPHVSTPISPPVLWVLERRQEQKQKKIPYVFYNPDTEDCWKDLRGSWGTSLQKAGIINERISFHSLRGTFARHLEDDGLSLSQIQRLLGHTALATTQRYLERNETGKKAKAVINGLMSDVRFDGTPAPLEEDWKIEAAEWQNEREEGIWVEDDWLQEVDI